MYNIVIQYFYRLYHLKLLQNNGLYFPVLYNISLLLVDTNFDISIRIQAEAWYVYVVDCSLAFLPSLWQGFPWVICHISTQASRINTCGIDWAQSVVRSLDQPDSQLDQSTDTLAWINDCYLNYTILGQFLMKCNHGEDQLLHQSPFSSWGTVLIVLCWIHCSFYIT